MADEEQITPVDIRQAGDFELGIRWGDGHESIYPCDYLRKACRCANCIDEWSGTPRVNPGDIPSDIQPVQIESVGRYGIKIDWDDGHNTGIYGFDYLRKICPCDKCRAER